jgi:hypothetical protein
MQNPAAQISYPVLAGTILAMSALRAGARVMVTLSGEPGSFTTTGDFLRDEHAILNILTGYLGTGYAFGIHRLSETFDRRSKKAREAHILIITDHDIFAMLQEKAKGRDGWTAARAALESARGGGTYVLHMPPKWGETKRMEEEGWSVASIVNWEDIVPFAREFAKKKWEV